MYRGRIEFYQTLEREFDSKIQVCHIVGQSEKSSVEGHMI